MKTSPGFRLFASALALGACVFAAAPDSLEEGFASPPQAARPLVWWHWINGNVTKAGIDADLADMRRVGIGGVQMFDVSIYLPPGPVRYGTPLWHEHVRLAIREAAKEGLEFYAMNTPGWSASGGPWVTPERSMKQLVWSEKSVTVSETSQLVVELPRPTAKLGFYRDVAVLVFPEDEKSRRRPAAELRLKTKLAEKSIAARPLDLDSAGCILRSAIRNETEHFDAASGRLSLQLPAGRWTVLRFGFTSTGSTNHPAVPEGHGLEIDKLDSDAVAFQFDRAIGPLLEDAGPLVGTTFKGILFDSFEGGPQNWTDTLPAQFSALKGYDLVPLLPVLAGRTIETPTFTECVLSDFRSAVEELIAKNYFGTMQRKAREHGLVVYAEAQGGPLNPVLCNEYVDVPMNEFWLPDVSARSPRLKLISSIAHLGGKPLVGAEAFTAKPEEGRWLAVPSTLKKPGDGAWIAGINRFVLHHYVHQPGDDGPGFGLGRYGTHFGRLNSWWPLAKGWIDYVSRGQFLLQQGKAVADVCYLHNNDLGYGFPTSLIDVPAGYDFEICYPGGLRKMEFSGGLLRHPSGAEFRLLALPPVWAADLATLRKLRELCRAGATVVGAAPVAPAGLKDYENLAEFRELVAALWGGDGAGAAILKRPVAEALESEPSGPDVVFPEDAEEEQLRFVHRRTKGADIYFVSNHAERSVSGSFSFRVKARLPELWDAVSGVFLPAPVFERKGDRMTVPLSLEPNGSLFVVFRAPLPARWVVEARPLVEEPRTGRLFQSGRESATLVYSDGSTARRAPVEVPEPAALAGPWLVSFQSGRGAPEAASFERLESWSENRDPGIRHFSGVAVYRTRFSVSASAHSSGACAFLDLGAVADLAEVRVNGQAAGILWLAPFRVDVTRFLKAGENELEVSVANRWINRVIGDESVDTELQYKATGNKFTEGALESSPSWLYDPSKRSEKKRVSFTTWRHYTAASPLVPSGLLGPVRLEWRRELGL